MEKKENKKHWFWSKFTLSFNCLQILQNDQHFIYKVIWSNYFRKHVQNQFFNVFWSNTIIMPISKKRKNRFSTHKTRKRTFFTNFQKIITPPICDKILRFFFKMKIKYDTFTKKIFSIIYTIFPEISIIMPILTFRKVKFCDFQRNWHYDMRIKKNSFDLKNHLLLYFE